MACAAAQSLRTTSLAHALSAAPATWARAHATHFSLDQLRSHAVPPAAPIDAVAGMCALPGWAHDRRWSQKDAGYQAASRAECAQGCLDDPTCDGATFILWESLGANKNCWFKQWAGPDTAAPCQPSAQAAAGKTFSALIKASNCSEIAYASALQPCDFEGGRLPGPDNAELAALSTPFVATGDINFTPHDVNTTSGTSANLGSSLQPTATACAKVCLATADCNAFTWMGSNPEWTREETCWLKAIGPGCVPPRASVRVPGAFLVMAQTPYCPPVPALADQEQPAPAPAAARSSASAPLAAAAPAPATSPSVDSPAAHGPVAATPAAAADNPAPGQDVGTGTTSLELSEDSPVSAPPDTPDSTPVLLIAGIVGGVAALLACCVALGLWRTRVSRRRQAAKLPGGSAAANAAEARGLAYKDAPPSLGSRSGVGSSSDATQLHVEALPVVKNAPGAIGQASAGAGSTMEADNASSSRRNGAEPCLTRPGQVCPRCHAWVPACGGRPCCVDPCSSSRRSTSNVPAQHYKLTVEP